MSRVTLTAEQRLAVARRSEPLALSAAAGSGKTSVLVERFVAAVREDGLAPAKILAITFTERAAGELRARVRARLLELGEREAARDTEAAFIGTFHGFCARLLRAHALAAGLDPAFAILDEGRAGRLREQAFASALREFLAGERDAAVDLLAAYGVDRVHALLEQVHAELRSRGQRLPRLPPSSGRQTRSALVADEDARAQRALDAQAAKACVLLDELLRGFGSAYERLKRARDAVDFDDLELITRELLLERASLTTAWSERFELLMVDEFQDTNPRQLAILTALDRGNLLTVGDELQSIYGFRHADVSLFRARTLELERHGASIRLTRNFRGRAALLEVVNAAFAERFPGYTPLLAGRGEGEHAERGDPAVELLLTDVRGWEEPAELAGAVAAGLPQAQLWRQAEARMLAQRVAGLVGEGVARPDEMVVLVRALGDLEVFERALQIRGLRTLAAVGSFWGHQQVADLIAYLRALANPLDESALYAALASPLAGCSLDGLALLADAARASGRGAWETALADPRLATELTDGDRRGLAAFCARLRSERSASSRRTIAELLLRALRFSGYREHVLGLDRPARRLANVHKLVRLARDFEASEGGDLRGFLDHVEHLADAARAEPDAPVEGVEPDAVRLMTIHAAKGLEFPVVCVADLGRQPNTQTPDLLVDGPRIGLRLMRLDGAGSSPALDYESLCRERRGREAQEEDRILYVAMTRARERLLLSGAVDFARWPSPRQAGSAISWLAPALSAELPRLAGAGAGAAHELAIDEARSARMRLWLNTPANVGLALAIDDRAPTALGEQPRARPEHATARPEHATARPGERPASAGEQLSLSLGGIAPATPEAGAVDTIATVENEEEVAPRDVEDEAEVAPRDPVAREAILPSTLSYSSLTELERCGYRFYLERVLGMPERRAGAFDAARGLQARERGTLIHRLLETRDFARARPLTAEEVARRARALGMRVGGAERAEIAELISAAFTAAPAARLAAARAVWREHPFAFSPGAGEPLVTGVIDLLAQEAADGYLIVDYKSDRVGAHTDLAALVEAEYAIQRELYALALLRGPAASVEVVHWFLERPHEWVGTRYRAGDRDALHTRLLSRLADARARGFKVSSAPHRALCLTCPGRGGLCSWSEARTLQENPDRIAFEHASR
ncbi:MAG TPA: UvrD-helicase domain-containing protein [Solirubrobacteraceae bacterium]|nr:UvrD-helicase domain-containing protein [Solirubrobacteraceae bacterium]